jgi:dGTP triphosphohydrolase
MKDIPGEEMVARYKATQYCLAHLANTGSHRRNTYGDLDVQCLDDPFIRDIGAIFASKAFRRQPHKNQVACSDRVMVHLRDRNSHIMEVISQTLRIANHLGLNTNLAQAIAAGHDIGHVPFGHQGEAYLQKILGEGFCHEVMGVVIMQHIERKGCGANITHATLDGMHRHSGRRASEGMTQEAWVVRFADKIAYLFADYNDFHRLDHKCSPELEEMMDWFGRNQRRRSFATIMALCEESAQAGKVQFESSEAAINFATVRELMYQEYIRIVEQDVSSKLDPIYSLLERGKLIPPALGIALLTDVEVSHMLSEKRLLSTQHIMNTGLGEIIKLVPHEKLFSLSMTDLDLDW